MKNVLFVCVGNSGRSQMAGAFFNHPAGGKAKAMSAGTYAVAIGDLTGKFVVTEPPRPVQIIDNPQCPPTGPGSCGPKGSRG